MNCPHLLVNPLQFYCKCLEVSFMHVVCEIIIIVDSPFPVTDQEDEINASDANSRIIDPDEKMQTNSQKKLLQKLSKGDGISSSRSPQQMAFEHFKLSLSKKSE